MDQREQRAECGAFVPMIEDGAEQLLASENRDGGADEGDGVPSWPSLDFECGRSCSVAARMPTGADEGRRT